MCFLNELKSSYSVSGLLSVFFKSWYRCSECFAKAASKWDVNGADAWQSACLLASQGAPEGAPAWSGKWQQRLFPMPFYSFLIFCMFCAFTFLSLLVLPAIAAQCQQTCIGSHHSAPLHRAFIGAWSITAEARMPYICAIHLRMKNGTEAKALCMLEILRCRKQQQYSAQLTASMEGEMELIFHINALQPEQKTVSSDKYTSTGQRQDIL